MKRDALLPLTERLNATGNADAVRRRHLMFHLALAEQAEPGLVGPRQAEWLEQLDFERENILAAHSACDRQEDGAAMGARLVHAIRAGRQTTAGELQQLGDLVVGILFLCGDHIPLLTRPHSLRSIRRRLSPPALYWP